MSRWTSVSLWSSLLLAVVACLFFVASLGFRADARTFPLMVSAFTLLALALVLLGEVFPRIERYFEVNWTGTDLETEDGQSNVSEVLNAPGAETMHLGDVPWRMLGTVFGSLLLLSLLILLAGFFVAVPLFILVFLQLYGEASWKGAVVLAIGSTVAILALSSLIQTPLYSGVLFGAPVPPF